MFNVFHRSYQVLDAPNSVPNLFEGSPSRILFLMIRGWIHLIRHICTILLGTIEILYFIHPRKIRLKPGQILLGHISASSPLTDINLKRSVHDSSGYYRLSLQRYQSPTTFKSSSTFLASLGEYKCN